MNTIIIIVLRNILIVSMLREQACISSVISDMRDQLPQKMFYAPLHNHLIFKGKDKPNLEHNPCLIYTDTSFVNIIIITSQMYSPYSYFLKTCFMSLKYFRI